MAHRAVPCSGNYHAWPKLRYVGLCEVLQVCCFATRLLTISYCLQELGWKQTRLNVVNDVS